MHCAVLAMEKDLIVNDGNYAAGNCYMYSQIVNDLFGGNIHFLSKMTNDT